MVLARQSMTREAGQQPGGNVNPDDEMITVENERAGQNSRVNAASTRP